MSKIKNNKIIDLRNKSEEEKSLIMAQISREINKVFEENKDKEKEKE